METTISSVSTDTFARRVEAPNHNILDARPMAAYNGWPQNGASRGGHVPGATSIPLGWTQYMDWVEVPEEKELSPEVPITLYADGLPEGEKMADYLMRLGFEDVSVYSRFQEEWVADADRPLRRLDRYEQLVPPSWVHALINGENPDGDDGDDYVLCHAHYGYIDDYDDGHIPTTMVTSPGPFRSTPIYWSFRTPGIGGPRA